jgi:hypothetical protein
MRRTAVLALVLIAMLWQSVALARVGSTISVLSDLEHAVLHWQGHGHHHNDDGSFHPDGSVESLQHALGDHASATVVLPPSPSHDFPPSGSASPRAGHDASAPHPFLDGPLRPPRPRS